MNESVLHMFGATCNGIHGTAHANEHPAGQDGGTGPAEMQQQKAQLNTRSWNPIQPIRHSDHQETCIRYIPDYQMMTTILNLPTSPKHGASLKILPHPLTSLTNEQGLEELVGGGRVQRVDQVGEHQGH
jgi:hypothetical protein